jgi:hypothetical protein
LPRPEILTRLVRVLGRALVRAEGVRAGGTLPALARPISTTSAPLPVRIILSTRARCLCRETGQEVAE